MKLRKGFYVSRMDPTFRTDAPWRGEPGHALLGTPWRQNQRSAPSGTGGNAGAGPQSRDSCLRARPG